MGLWKDTKGIATRSRCGSRRLASLAIGGCGMLALTVASPLAQVAPTVVSKAKPTPPKAVTPVSALFTALAHCPSSLPELERWRIAGIIQHQSQRYGYDPLFVLAMVEVESGCSPTARSHKGAVGLIQMKPSTAKAVAKEVGLPWLGADMLNSPTFNVRLALHYLSQLESQFRDPYLAMAAYNLGPTRASHMSRKRARHVRYVRKILAQYESLLAEHPVGRS